MNKRANDIDSDSYYKSIASKYKDLSGKRECYLKAIEDLVSAHSPRSIERYLDAGAGDGRRAMKIGQRVNASEITLLDSCANMLPQADKCQPHVGTICSPVSELQQKEQYELITCLWNVLGHMPTREERVDALVAMRGALRSGGRLMIDVNNRHNFEYGFGNILKNFLIGLLKPSRRGRFELHNGDSTHTVHISNHKEMLQLIHEANMHIEAQYTVSYRSGELKKRKWQGQLFYVLTK